MPPLWLRVLLVLNLLFIQILWTLTTRGSNITGFFKTFTSLRSVPIVLFHLFLFTQALLPINTSISLGNLDRVLLFLGISGVIGGTTLASWSKIVMGGSWGRPAQHDKKVQSSLVTNGPFAFSRNPLYVGLFIQFVGQEIALRSYFIFLAPLFCFAIWKAVSTEEKLLGKYFGKIYFAYQKRTPRFL